MRILHLDQLEGLLPIRPLFLKRNWTIANLHTAGRAVPANPGIPHVLAPGYGTLAEGP
jgi:hypothetical protein